MKRKRVDLRELNALRRFQPQIFKTIIMINLIQIKNITTFQPSLCNRTLNAIMQSLTIL